MLAPWKESYDKPRQRIKKQRHHFANKDLHSQSYGFSSSHVQRESWTIKNAECRRMDAFKLWCWRRLLRVPWTARRWNQSILKEINPEYSLEGLMLKLELQYLTTWCEEPTHWKIPWYWERLRAGAEGGNSGWDGWLLSLTRVWANLGDNEEQGSLACCSPWACKKLDKTQQLNNSGGVTWLFLPHSSS